MSKPKLLLSLLIMGVAILSLAAATYSFFSVGKTASVNKFSAGTLDLDVLSEGKTLHPFVIANIGAASDIKGKKVFTVKNKGSLPGSLQIGLENILNKENGCNDPEIEAEPDCQKDQIGDLGKIIDITASADGNVFYQIDLTGNADPKVNKKLILNPGESKDVIVAWSADGEEYGNEIQSDSVSFDIAFRLTQVLK